MLRLQRVVAGPHPTNAQWPTRTHVCIITYSGRDCRNVPGGTYVAHCLGGVDVTCRCSHCRTAQPDWRKKAFACSIDRLLIAILKLLMLTGYRPPRLMLYISSWGDHNSHGPEMYNPGRASKACSGRLNFRTGLLERQASFYLLSFRLPPPTPCSSIQYHCEHWVFGGLGLLEVHPKSRDNMRPMVLDAQTRVASFYVLGL